MNNTVSLVLPDRVRAAIGTLDLPAYVIDLAGLRAHVRAVRAALAGRVELWYAVKANPEPPVLRALADLVAGFEVASAGELRRVVATVPGAPVAFGGPGKTPAEVAAAVGAGVHRVHVESPHELRLLGWTARELGASVDVLLRLNLPGAIPGAVLSMAGPFGIDPALLPECRAILADHPWLRLRGVHAHLASGLPAADLAALAGRVLRDPAVAALLGDGGELNLGGGMAVDYREPANRFDWPAYAAALPATAHPLRIEPGRALVAYCGWYVTRVLDVKRAHGGSYAVLAGGTHHLRTPVAKGHDQPFVVVPVDGWPHQWPRPGVGGGRVTLVGQLCTPKDVLARNVPVPAIRAGDTVAFGLAGGYGWHISHRDFLLHPPPAFRYLD
jgi:diaminopimelate decarboxylase